jgi:hypothetical protein
MQDKKMNEFECSIRLNGETVDVIVEYDEEYQVFSVREIDTGASVSLRSTAVYQRIEEQLYDHLMSKREYFEEG